MGRAVRQAGRDRLEEANAESVPFPAHRSRPWPRDRRVVRCPSKNAKETVGPTPPNGATPRGRREKATRRDRQARCVAYRARGRRNDAVDRCGLSARVPGSRRPRSAAVRCACYARPRRRPPCGDRRRAREHSPRPASSPTRRRPRGVHHRIPRSGAGARRRSRCLRRRERRSRTRAPTAARTADIHSVTPEEARRTNGARAPLLRPPAIVKGDTIAVVSPSYAPKLSWLSRGVRALERAGFVVRLAPEIEKLPRFTRSEDERRAENLMGMWLNPEVKAIIASTGGYGTVRL